MTASLFDHPDAPASNASITRNCKLVIAYDGSDFHGFAEQPGQRSVLRVLRSTLAQIANVEGPVHGAGRTDAGVHAWGQVVSFRTSADTDLERLRVSLTSMLGPELVVRSAEYVDDAFDARRSALSRTYRYTVVNGHIPDPFNAKFSWWIDKPLDLHVLRIAADAFIGQHDFASFCRKASNPLSTTTRRVTESRWVDLGDGVLRYEITANAFCWQMVRSILGTIVEAGLGRRRAGDMLTILRARDRTLAGNVAPAQGLCLWDVAY